jgi:hypothetical protein
VIARILDALAAEHTDQCVAARCGRCDADYTLSAQIAEFGTAAGTKALAKLIGDGHPATLAALKPSPLPRQQAASRWEVAA